MKNNGTQSLPAGDQGCAVKVRLAVLESIRKDIGMKAPEHNGMLGMDTSTGVITEFVYDDSSARTSVSNSPNVNRQNEIIREEWEPKGIQFVGAPHSHPAGCRQPSGGDIAYGRRILAAKKSLDRLHIWIVMPAVDGHPYELLPFALDRNGELEAVRIVAVDADGAEVPIDADGDRSAAPQKDDVPVRRIKMPRDVHAATRNRRATDVSGHFARVGGAYDAVRLARSRLIWIGTGGIRDTILDTIRAGVEEHVLIDPDTVGESNIGTQGVYLNEVDEPKTAVIEQAAAQINPNCRIVALQMSLDDLDDSTLEGLIREPMLSLPWPGRGNLHVDLPPLITISVAGTDSFTAQARNNRIGLNWGIPTLNSQVYNNGLGAEISFTHPEITPACQRCALCNRYRAFLEKGFRNDVGSSGAPICATRRLAALEFVLIMALLHHGTTHPRFGGLLTRIGRRSLVQIRMDPDISQSLGLGIFDRVYAGADRERVLFDDVVWLPQEPENGSKGRPVCPECRGSGNLRSAIGTFADTRLMPA